MVEASIQQLLPLSLSVDFHYERNIGEKGGIVLEGKGRQKQALEELVKIEGGAEDLNKFFDFQTLQQESKIQIKQLEQDISSPDDDLPDESALAEQIALCNQKDEWNKIEEAIVLGKKITLFVRGASEGGATKTFTPVKLKRNLG